MTLPHETFEGFRSLPKAELHLHLEASIRATTAVELADHGGAPVPRAGPFRNLTEFVVAYEAARDLIRSLDDLRRVARELVEDAASQGTVWTEVHIIPPTYAGRLGPDEAILEAVLDGLRSGTSAESSAGVIVGVNRGLPLAAAAQSLALALRYRDVGVVGLGLAGDEANHPAEAFADIFARARGAGLPAVPHGGEGAGPASVRACVEVLGARRVNHGVRAIEDPAVLDLLVERQVCLDVCPSSNVALQVNPSLERHPLPALIEAGVAVSLNSDGPLFTGVPLLAEYENAHRRMGLSCQVLAQVARTSLIYSSCPAGRLDEAIRRLTEWQSRHTDKSTGISPQR